MASKSPALSGSPLSALSDALLEDAIPLSVMPPAKRQKLGQPSLDSLTPPKFLDDVSISSDSSGDVPHSPSHQRGEEDEIHEQVTVCRWAGCDAGDMANMDNLVAHIHDDHVETRTKKYICEWNDCGRKSMPHASAYALKAHMRSHTKEKPFYCELPECDRSFTRSDALQKHYRTVHETEALRPSDPVPKSMQTANKLPRAKSTSKVSHSSNGGHLPNHVNGTSNVALCWTSSFPHELGFTPEDEARSPKELYRLLRRQVHWAEEEANSLRKSFETLEELRRKEWAEKEILLDHALKTDIDWHNRRHIELAQRSDALALEEDALSGQPVIHDFSLPKNISTSASSAVPSKGQPNTIEATKASASLPKE